MSNRMDKAAGKAKEVAGKMTGNHKLELKGKAEQEIAELKQVAHDAKERINARVRSY